MHRNVLSSVSTHWVGEGSCGNGRPCLLPVTDWLFLEQQPSSTKSPPQSKDDDQPAAPVRCHSTYDDEDGVDDVDDINDIVRTTTTSSSPSLDNQDLRLPSPASHYPAKHRWAMSNIIITTVADIITTLAIVIINKYVFID